MILVRNLRLSPGEEEEALRRLAARELRCPEGALRRWKIVKKSLDARKKSDVHYLYSVAVEVKGDEKRALRAGSKNCQPYTPLRYTVTKCQASQRPVVAGFGPAGIFAALVLAKAGLRPIVVERGCAADERKEKVEHFWATGELDRESNVQFGEGGAGLFSDGKLNTNTHDERIAWVLEQLHAHGAPAQVCYDAKPHVGTDVLLEVVKQMRTHVEALGGEVRTRTKLVGLELDDTGRLCAVTLETAAGVERLPCRDLILAVGHSARDTFRMLHELGVPMERKAFSMGVRIEHKQAMVGRSQLGAVYDRLPAADYKLNCTLPDGGSAYTFCMCPGGYVVAAASEDGGVVTNGMSYSARDGENANAALLVTLKPEDFPGEGVLAGCRWQREIEQRCFAYGGGDYRAPAQTVGDFLDGKASEGDAGVEPTYRPGVVWGDLRQVLPAKITDTIAAALPVLGQKMQGFDVPEAVMTAPETRSSSPVRILRGEDKRSAWGGFFPCGEGAGYAGGITSAAVDGMKCAEAVIAQYR